ncbi:hypothetical protein [Demequina sp.]|uniref:hypothetical protein n=1 Tax=Demequina sp. TaxID=2050685 RepID=UPI0025EB686D|nr:hypothetical protein [Demequina sp.]
MTGDRGDEPGEDGAGDGAQELPDTVPAEWTEELGDGTPAPDRPRGRDPEVAFPLAIVSTALGVVGLTVPSLAWVAAALGVISYLLRAPHGPTRAFAIIGTVFGLVGIGSAFVG